MSAFVIIISICAQLTCKNERPEPDVTYKSAQECVDSLVRQNTRWQNLSGKTGVPQCLEIDDQPSKKKELSFPIRLVPAPEPPPPPKTEAALPSKPEPKVEASPKPSPKPTPPIQQAANAIPKVDVNPLPSKEKLNDREFKDCPHCPVMVPIAGGSFEMGSNEDSTERPPHHVSIAPFAIGKYLVTVGEWNACVVANACSYHPPAGDDRMPISNISWADAHQYVAWLQKVTKKPYRLPSEAEFEYAAAAGTTTRYSWGDQPGAGNADCRGCGSPYQSNGPMLVGSYAPNSWGLHDMQGGLSEWVEDCWHISYQGAPNNGAAWVVPNCSSHVTRGGSWMNPPTDIAVRTRNFYDTYVRYEGNGMRVALSMP